LHPLELSGCHLELLKCQSEGQSEARTAVPRTEDRVSLEREGPWAGAHPPFLFFLLQPGLLCLRSFFFNQSSFFGLVRPGESVREVMVVMVRGPLQELTLGRLALVGVPTDGGDHGHHDGGDHHRWPRLATPAHVLGAAAADVALLVCRKDNCCCCNFKCFAAAGPALGGSSQAPPPSSCDLLRPGLL